MKLVDTSAWIHALRPEGDPVVRENVRRLLESGSACWCAMVRLELWNGARGGHEQKVLKDMARDLPELAISDAVWRLAMELASRASRAGQTIPATDLLIAACARHHVVDVEHADRHFDVIAGLYPHVE